MQYIVALDMRMPRRLISVYMRPWPHLLHAMPCLPSTAGSIPLRPELAALRQRLYKLDNKVKHDFKRDAGELRACLGGRMNGCEQAGQQDSALCLQASDPSALRLAAAAKCPVC